MNLIDKTVGDRIRSRRINLGLSQIDLAEKIGVRFQQVQKYEKGTNRVAASRLWQIAEALNVGVAYFFEGLGDAARPVHCDAHSADDGAIPEIVGMLRRLPDTKKDAVRSLLRAFDDETKGPPTLSKAET